MELSELWIEHSQARFPDRYGGIDVNGICVTSIDTYATGCVSTYMKRNQTSIELEKYQKLKNCKNELDKVLPHVEGEAFEYFSRLREICNLVINDASIA